MNGSARGLNVGIESLRCMAISLVLLEHLKHFFAAPAWWTHLVEKVPGWAGVDVFLAVSGYVVTLSFVERSSTVSDFLRKRAFRLLPSAWFWGLVTLVVFIVLGGGIPGAEPGSLLGDLLASSTMTGNIHRAWCVVGGGSCGTPLAFGPHWSLALEWQFYVLLPFVLVRGRVSASVFLVLGVLMLFSLPVRTGNGFGWYLRYDALLTGALLALAQGWVILTAFAPSALVRAVVAVTCVAVVCVISGPRGSRVIFDNKFTIMALVATCAVLFAGVNLPVIRGRHVDAVKWLGSRSYALYLAHAPAYMVIGTVVTGAGVTANEWTFGFCALCGTSLALILADASYRYLEIPLRRFGERVPVFVSRPSTTSVP